MYNRYGDISKFIMDMEQLCIADDGYVYISKEEDYDIAAYLESRCGPLDEVKPFLVFLAAHICELDNLVQRFYQKKRVKNGGRGYVCLPSPIGVLRFDYLPLTKAYKNTTIKWTVNLTQNIASDKNRSGVFVYLLDTVTRRDPPISPASSTEALLDVSPVAAPPNSTAGAACQGQSRRCAAVLRTLDWLSRLCYLPRRDGGYILQSRPLSLDRERAGG